MKKMDSIKAPITEELKAFERTFREAMSSDVPLLDKVTRYIVRSKGKQMRPMFVFLCAKLAGGVTPSTHHAAALVEMLHTATLVHDDVVDEAVERRGFFSINALWKNKIAVLVGDYLLSRGLLLAIDNGEFHLLQILSRAVKKMSEGEMLQIEKARRLDIKEEIYYDIISKKTASLIAAACAAGTASANEDAGMVEKMRLFGEKVGMAFQIRDDLFDFGTEDVGKPLGIDIKEKKMTLPLIHALERAGSSEKRQIINIIKNHNLEPDRVAEVITFVRNSGGLEYAKEVMLRYQEEGLGILRAFPQSPERKALEDLVMFVTQRKK